MSNFSCPCRGTTHDPDCWTLNPAKAGVTPGREVWYCEKHDAMGQHTNEKEQCDVAQLVEAMQGWPKTCVLRRALITDVGPRNLPALADSLAKESS